MKNEGCSVWGGADEGFDCQHSKTFAQAEAICATAGARLCTVAELEDGCAAGTAHQRAALRDAWWQAT